MQSAKGKSTWGEIQGDQVQDSQGPLPVEPHSMCLILPTMSYDNTCECCKPGRLIRDPASRVFTGNTLCLAEAESQTPRRKICVCHKPHCLYKQFRQSETLLSANGGSPSKIECPRHQTRVKLAGLLKKQYQASYINFFLYSMIQILFGQNKLIEESLHNSLSSLEYMDTIGSFDWPFVSIVSSEFLIQGSLWVTIQRG